MMRITLLASLSAPALSFAGCGGNLIGTEGRSGLPKGARPVPQSYYLPKGEVPLTITVEESKRRIDYETSFAAESVPDTEFGRLSLWHRHAGLSTEEAVVTVDPKTMILEKASSIFAPQTKEALDATAALIIQANALRVALKPSVEPLNEGRNGSTPVPCDGVKVTARIPIKPMRNKPISLSPIAAIAGCNFTLTATITPVDPARLRQDVTTLATEEDIRDKCAEVVCFRLPERFHVILNLDFTSETSKFKTIPQVKPFDVSAPDTDQVAYVKFPTGIFAAKATTLEFSDGMLETYTTKSDSATVGTLNVATNALAVATAAAVALH